MEKTVRVSSSFEEADRSDTRADARLTPQEAENAPRVLRAWDSREPAELDGVDVFFIGRMPWIHNKESTGRAKDLETPRSCAADIRSSNARPGVDVIPMGGGTSNLQAGEIFKIRGGKIYDVEAMGVSLLYGTKSGWEQ